MAIDRQSPRKVADRILCIQMEPNNEAIVLDVSDGGLGFRALSPVTRSGTICFSFSENGHRIETSGQLVWTDSTKKTGGLSFASLPRANRERIRKWVDQAGTSKSTGAASESAIPASIRSPFSSASPERASAAPTPFFPAPGMSSPPPELPGFALFEDDAQRAREIWDRETSFANSGAKFFSGFLVGAIISSILMAIVLFVYGNQTNDLLTAWRTRVGVSSAPQSAAAAPPSAADPAPAIPSVLPPSTGEEAAATPTPLPSSAEDSNTDIPIAKTAPEPSHAGDRVTPVPVRSVPKTADPGDDDLALAQPYLRNKSGPAGNAVAVRLLWAAVEKGNVKAEITLADLYSHGDGVAKSCDQARVLLRAAAEKGSSEASQELATMIRTGCR